MGKRVMVLGAGIVGTAAALQLKLRGADVVLIDRRGPGEETSFGNAGLIQREAVLPYSFPRDPWLLVQYALNLKPEAHYHLSALPKILPNLFRYFLNAAPDKVERTVRANAPLFVHSVSEHQKLAERAGIAPQLRPGGWIKAFRTEKKFAEERKNAEKLSPFGVTSAFLDPAGVQAIEPHLSDKVIGAIHWKDPVSLADPLALTRGYAACFRALGGTVAMGDALSLEKTATGWRVPTGEGPVDAEDAMVTLGPWAPDLLAKFGYSVPLFVKRGYHRHFRPLGNAVLNHPVLDADVGYVMAPMATGIRLTSGAEFTTRDAPETPVQIDRITPRARELLPLGEAVEARPWMGRRPCLPDMLPVMGKAPRHDGLWLNFGHAHHGLTLAACAGRLLAEMITGEAPFTDPAPYGLERFG